MRTFEDMWTGGLEHDAKTAGVADGDLSIVRQKVKAALVSATWSDNDGNLNIVSDKDMISCLHTAKSVLDKASSKLSQKRVKASLTAGQTPTKNSVLSAGTMSVVPTRTVVNAGFSPQLSNPGDACPKCGGQMVVVGLANNKPAQFCKNDRVCVPMHQG